LITGPPIWEEAKAETDTVAATATTSRARTRRRIESSFVEWLVLLVVRDAPGLRLETGAHFRDCSDSCSLLSGIAHRERRAEAFGVGDGKTFGQAVRALEKFMVEQSRSDDVPDPNSPIRLAYERIVTVPFRV
jgi:hypothetical protein